MADARLNLTRDQLAAFLKDHQSIKQFEKLFQRVDALPDSGTTDDTALDAANARTLAQQAVDLLAGLADKLDYLAYAITLPQEAAQTDELALLTATKFDENPDSLAIPSPHRAEDVFPPALAPQEVEFPFLPPLALGGVAEKDYQRVEFSPALSFGGASVGITYSTQKGLAIKIGDVVFVTANFRLANKGVSVGGALVSGLPFQSRNSTDGETTLSVQANNLGATAITMLASIVQNNSTSISVSRYAAGAAAQLTDVDFANNTIMRISGIYFTQ